MAGKRILRLWRRFFEAGIINDGVPAAGQTLSANDNRFEVRCLLGVDFSRLYNSPPRFRGACDPTHPDNIAAPSAIVKIGFQQAGSKGRCCCVTDVQR